MSKYRILDCTLRDGGYINDWEFTEHQYKGLIKGIQDANVEIMELGLMGKKENTGFSTKFVDFRDVPQVPDNDTIYTIMYTTSEMENYKEIPLWEKGMFQGIRFAFFKTETKKAIEYLNKIKNKGYKLFLQPMATFQYSTRELIELVRKVNRIKPYAFYIVDSFGTMYASDVVRIFDIINDELLPEINIGFHAHNNMQLAFSNVITFVKNAQRSNRDVIVDASIYGMGRGAGNVNLELVADYLNKNFDKNYQLDDVIKLYSKYISEEYQKNYWGYSMQYFLSSREKVNVAYIWYLNRKGITDIQIIQDILKKIPEAAKTSLDKTIVDEIIDKQSVN